MERFKPFHLPRFCNQIFSNGALKTTLPSGELEWLQVPTQTDKIAGLGLYFVNVVFSYHFVFYYIGRVNWWLVLSTNCCQCHGVMLCISGCEACTGVVLVCFIFGEKKKPCMLKTDLFLFEWHKLSDSQYCMKFIIATVILFWIFWNCFIEDDVLFWCWWVVDDTRALHQWNKSC